MRCARGAAGSRRVHDVCERDTRLLQRCNAPTKREFVARSAAAAAPQRRDSGNALRVGRLRTGSVQQREQVLGVRPAGSRERPLAVWSSLARRLAGAATRARAGGCSYTRAKKPLARVTDGRRRRRRRREAWRWRWRRRPRREASQVHAGACSHECHPRSPLVSARGSRSGVAASRVNGKRRLTTDGGEHAVAVARATARRARRTRTRGRRCRTARAASSSRRTPARTASRLEMLSRC